MENINQRIEDLENSVKQLLRKADSTSSNDGPESKVDPGRMYFCSGRKPVQPMGLGFPFHDQQASMFKEYIDQFC